MGKEIEISISDAFVEECDALICETVFASRWDLVEGYWKLGKLIREGALETPITQFTEQLAVRLKRSQRFLWYCVQAYDRYPDLSMLPEGKNISWHKIIKRLENKGDEALPALPSKEKLAKIVNDYLPWMLDNLTQNKKGVNLFLSYERIYDTIYEND